MEWVTLQKASAETGYSVPALRAKINRGQLQEARHWVKAPDGRVMIHLPSFFDWINSNTTIIGNK